MSLTKQTSTTLMKKIIASVFLFGSCMSAHALTIKAENETVCPHEGVILNSSLSSASSVVWQKYEGGKWINASDEGSQLKVGVPFIYEMDDHDVQFRAVEKSGTTIVATSNVIKITKGTDCVPDCHTSSTGDFINGTDFDKKPEYSNVEKPEIPSQIESFFPEYNVGFENLYGNYKVTKDLLSTFNGQLPIKDGAQQNNSYYVFTQNLEQTHPFRYIYPCNKFYGKDYRLVMRMYLMRKNPSCTGQSAALKLETEQGEQTTDRAKIVIVDDKEDKLIRQEYITENYGLVRLNLTDNAYANKLLRVDVTFYGHFPDDKYDSNTGKYNGLTEWVLKPFFQQFDGCFTIAVDYLSAEVENVCLSPKLQCKGEFVNATAFGFADDVSYTWYEEYSPGKWSKVFGDYHGKGDKYRVLPIFIDFIGSRNYKVVVDKPDNKKSSELTFTVYGKECNPIMPSDIIGDDLICAPDNNKVYSVDPVSEDPSVEYRWKLITPSGKVIENSTVYEGMSMEVDQKTKGASVRLILPSMTEHGKYTLQAQVIRIKTENGTSVTDLIGDPISRTIVVHNTPNPKLSLTGNFVSGTLEQDKTLCPADVTTKIIANVDVLNKDKDDKYVFNWTGATSSSKSSTTASVSWDHDAACAGTLKNHTVSVTASIDGVGCPATVSQKYTFEKPVDPTIDCSKINKSKYQLGEKQKTMTIDLPLPDYTASCDPDPKMTIEVVVKDLDGKVLSGTNQSRVINFSMSQASVINKKVTAPAGTVELTYSVTDGCGKTETCSAVVTVEDVTPPNIDCDAIKPYTAHLKNQSGCEAVPGYFPTELPKISQPKLSDLNGVDGTITGEYMGRVEKDSEPSMNPSGFKKTKDYNDPYKKGVTWILWAFSDKSENTKYCLQKITVIDDKKPNVICPNVDLGTLDVDTLTCTLKPSSVIAKIKEVSKLPYGFDECSLTPEDTLVPTLYYRIPKEGDDLYEIKESQMNDPIFETGVKYELVWVFKKIGGSYVDENVSVECPIPFMAEDQDAPEFDCSSLINIMVYPNFVMTTTEVKYDTYASGMGQDKDVDNKTYTLKKYFEDGFLAMHDDVVDICGGPVEINVVITAPSGKKTIIKNLDEFKKYRFEGDPAGKEARSYTITYTFTDQRFNTKTCEQIVTVVRNIPPVPDCNTNVLTINTDEDCKAIYNMTLDQIPTAKVVYYHAARYGSCQNAPGAGPGAGLAVKDCSKMVPKTKKDGPGGGEMKFEDFTTLSGSKSGFDTIMVYPDSVRLYDAEGGIYTIKNPLNPETDRVVTKDVTFRTFLSDGKPCACKEDVPYGYATANLSNFKTLPSIVDDYNLPVGINKYVWYFSNAFEKEDLAAKVLVDSCVMTVEVKDTIAPTLVCGPWEGTSTFYADESCELSQTDVKVVKPTIEQLKATDNCTKPEDLTLSWSRVYKGKKSTSLSAPYKVGVTTIHWIVSDESGNKDTCTQFIEVLDTLGPSVDCDVVTPPLTAYVDATCMADAEVVKKFGLQIPEIDDDPCSPIGGKIKGVGVRDDGKDVMTAPYPKGETIITWTFKDAAGAASVCKQTITVLDTMKPVFDCSEIMDTTIALASDKCELSLEEVLAALGSHTAVDNCDGDINGVPMLRDKNEDKDIALPESFHKDTTYHIVWHFVDKANNDQTCDQYMTVADTTPPDASDACKKLTDKKVVATDVCELPFANLNVNLNSSIEDLCDGTIKAKVQAFVTQFDGSVLRYDDDDIKDVMFPVGTHKFLYIYTDNANLSDTCIMYRTVEDGTAPVILDCFDGKDTVMGNVSSDVCGMTYEDLKDLIIIPKSYDECDNLANGGSVLFIDPIVKRYFWNIETKEYDLVVDGMDNEEWKVDPFPVGLTKLKFIFFDKAGNVDSCIKLVNVVDDRGPSFDCSKIDPNPYYPVAKLGECSVTIGDIWDILNGDYVATRSCTDEKIPGVLTLNGTDTKVPEDFELVVGRDYHLLWVFRSEIDGKVSTCDQIIRPNHQNELDAHCDNAADIEMSAEEGTCAIDGDSVITKFPYGIDFCTNDTIWGVPHRSDSLEISDPFPTGPTHITWVMVSPFNVEDTAICEQDIYIKGNKKFDIVCDELTPAMYKLVGGCDSVYMGDTLEIPYADDPCADPDSSYFKRPGVGTRSDDSTLDPIEDKYPLGITWIEWVFTDFTGAVKDTCNQLVHIRTSEVLQLNCDSINKDTINIPVAEGECSIDASQVKDSLLTRGYPIAMHPCGLGEFVGTPTRPNGLTMDDPFYVGPNEIIWVFVDSTTHTLADSVVTCTQIVRVGDVNVPPVDCSQMPDTLIVLNPYDCDIEFSELGLDIKPVYDLCSGAHIDSVVTRASMPGYSSEYGDDIFSEPFKVGVDTVYWKYNFGAYNFLCTQVVTVKDSMAPVIDCDSLLDEIITLPEGVCEIIPEHVLDSIKQPYAYEYCTGDEIKGVAQLMTISSTDDTTYSALPSKFVVGEPYKISWLFENDSLSVLSKRCDIELTIIGSSKPIFDCSIFKDTVKKYIEGECDVTLDDQILPIQQGEDACVKDYVVYGKAYKVDTVDNKPTYSLLAEMKDGTPSYKLKTLSVGVYNIAWVFESKYSIATDTCNEILNILTDKRIDIACVELGSFEPTSEDSCTTSLTLVPPVAKNPCTDEVILPDTVIRSDKIPFKGIDDTFYVGKTTLYWIYVDHSKTLKDSIDTCTQIVQVGDIKEEPIQCPKDTVVTLPIGVCQLDPQSILLNDSTPYFMDFCADTIVPLLNVWRSSGLAITEPFDLGVDTVHRKYFYHGVEYICDQIIKVRNAAIDSFNCDLLGEKDTIVVELKTSANEVPFSEVEKMGFKIPVLHNECGQLDSVYTRSDGLNLKDPYPLGFTTITLTVRDTTPGSEDEKICTRVVSVINTAAPSMDCPPLDDKKYVCHSSLPPAYKTFEEFINAGGKFVSQGVEVPELVDTMTFAVDSVIYDVLNNKVSTVNLCEYTLIRTYSALDVRSQNVVPCSDTFRVKDDVAPVWLEDVLSTLDSFVCTPTLPFDDSKVKAMDECWNVTYSNPVAKTIDTPLKSGIFYTDSTDRSSDPTKCEYYNYDLVRRYVAYDACNNHSDTIKFTRVVRDTVPPIINIPEWFNDTIIQADYARPCIFLVPDVDGILPPDIASDNCDPNASKYFKHTQIPPFGDTLKTQDGFVNVKIIIEDPCGLKDSIVKKVLVPTNKSIINQYMNDTTVCGEKKVLLSDNKISGYSGYIWAENWFTGKLDSVPTTSVVFDYFKDTISEKTVIYSNNQYGYSWKFNQLVGTSAYLTLSSYSQTGKYFVIATDTVRLCRDTASAYINVHEAPFVSLMSEYYTICENDSLPLVSGETSLYDRFSVYTFENGREITEEGWMVDGLPYSPEASIPYSDIPHTLQYYAINGCGTGTSTDGISIHTKAQMKPENLMLVTDPQNKPRVFQNESAQLQLVTKYNPTEYHWYKVNGAFDGRFEEVFDKEGNIKDKYKDLILEPDSLLEITYKNEANNKKYELLALKDTASYYVLMLDSVCPAVPSNVVSINVVKDIPTAFTPSNSLGMNDVFMEGYPVIIFNRYGQKMTESSNGWDGKCRGEYVDPGVYFYEVILRDKSKHKGTIEVVYFK